MLLCLFFLAAPDPALTVSYTDRMVEIERLHALGLQVSQLGLERPWDEPFTPRSLIVPQSWFTGHGKDTSVKASALLADLPILESIMSRAYGGWETASARGWNWEKWFADWRAVLAKQGDTELSLLDAFSPIKAFMAFQLDNHTNIPLNRATFFGSGSQQVLLPHAPDHFCSELEDDTGKRTPLAESDPAQQPRRVQHWDGKGLSHATYLSVPASRGTLRRVHCGDEWLVVTPVWPPALRFGSTEGDVARAKPIHDLSSDAQDEPTLKHLGDAVAYLRLPTFNKKNSQLFEQRAPRWPKPNGKERTLIVDLRDNDGGDANFDALLGWVDDTRLKQAIDLAVNVHRHEGASCLYEPLRWGYTLVSSTGLRPPLGAELTRDFQTTLDAFAKTPSTPRACPRAFHDSRSGWDYRQHKLTEASALAGKRRIIALVNNGCGSDCELMTEVLAALPETVIVGENTFGVAQYIQPGYAVLPHSRLPFRIALGTSDNYGDDRSFDGYGFDVDVLLTTESDQSPASILALAAALSDKASDKPGAQAH